MPDTARQISTGELQGLLDRARSDAQFRDKLLGSPADALREANLQPAERWVRFFSSLKASNFEEKMTGQIEREEGEAAL
jgi:hypothetical protein